MTPRHLATSVASFERGRRGDGVVFRLARRLLALGGMKATELLKQHHEEVDSLFSQLEQTDDASQKRALFDELAATLVAHDGIERKMFYPACEKKMGLTELLGESLVEHGLVEFSLHRADQNRRNKRFDHFITVLKEVVQHHVEEEEEELFAKVNDAFTDEELEALGEKMEIAFEEAKEEDYHDALLANLEQVLQGAEKTVPAKKPTAKKTATPNGKRPSARPH